MGPLTRWIAPLLLAGGLLLAAPAAASVDTFAASAAGLGGYTQLRMGDLQGAWETFQIHYAEDPSDALVLQGLAEICLYRREFDAAHDYMRALERANEFDRLEYLRAREAHAQGEWAAALEGYATCLELPGTQAWVLGALEAVYLELGDVHYSALVRGIEEHNVEAAFRLEARQSEFRELYGDLPLHEFSAGAPTPHDAAAYVEISSPTEIALAVQELWEAGDEGAGIRLLNAAQNAYPNHPRFSVLEKERLWRETCRIPVQPAKRSIPLTALGGVNPGGQGLAAAMPQDLITAGPLADYWNRLDAILVVSDEYYWKMYWKVQNLSAQIPHSVGGGGMAKLEGILYEFNQIVVDAIQMSENEIRSTSALPVPPGFEGFASKLREYQNLRTEMWKDFARFIKTQDVSWLDAADLKINELYGWYPVLVDEFMKAYQLAPPFYKVDPQAETALEDEEEKSDGELLYGPEFEFEIPADGDTERVDEGRSNHESEEGEGDHAIR